MGSLTKVDVELTNALKRNPSMRGNNDINVIYSYLRSIESLNRIRENSLKELCQRVRYEHYPPESTIYLRGQPITDWYLLLSGSVLVDGSLYLPQSVFGTRAPGSYYRHNDCLTLEDSELIAVSYPPLSNANTSTHISLALGTTQILPRSKSIMPQASDCIYVSPTVDIDEASGGTLKAGDSVTPGFIETTRSSDSTMATQQMQRQFFSRRISHASDTSSAYSGSECLSSAPELISCSSDPHNCSTLQGNNLPLGSSAASNQCCHFWEQQQEQQVQKVFYSDDEEEDLDSCSGCETHSLRDAFHDCLMKDPESRTSEDIDILMEGVQNLPVFSKLAHSIRRTLCTVMVGRTIKEAGQVILEDGEQMTQWIVLLHGLLECRRSDGTIKELNRGDAFGILPPDADEGIYFNVDPNYQLHQGVLRSRAEDCQLASVAQDIFLKVVASEVSYKHSVREAGQTVLVFEEKQEQSGKITKLINRATSEKLINYLVQSGSDMDPMYADDFLLTFRVFLHSARPITERLLAWYDDPSLRPRVTRCVLLWVNNHFKDFETYPYMRQFLTQLDRRWETETNSGGERRLFHLACSTKAKPRQVILNLTNQCSESSKKRLPFTLIGGHDSMGLFISEVSPGSIAENVGLQRGDQILRINSTSFEHISLEEGLEVLQKVSVSQEVIISVRYNPFNFYKMVELMKEQTYLRSDRFIPPSQDSTMSQKKLTADLQHRASISPLSPCSPQNYFTTRAKRIRSPSFDISLGLVINDSTHDSRGMSHSQSYAASLTAASNRRNKLSEIECCLEESESLNDTDHKPNCLSPPVSVTRSRSANTSPTRSPFNKTGNDFCTGSTKKCPPSTLAIASSPLSKSAMPSPNSLPSVGRVVNPSEELCQVVCLWYNLSAGSKPLNKLILFSPRFTAKDLVQRGMKEFGLSESNVEQFGLYLVTVVEGGSIRQRRLRDSEDELLSQLSLNSRYYLKNLTNQDPLMSNETIQEVANHSKVLFLQLTAIDLATFLTKEDFESIKAIEATEYLDHTFDLTVCSEGNSFGTGKQNLEKFIHLVKRHDHWAPFELCSEPNIKKRVKMLKHFLCIGKYLREMRSFNALFCLINSLDLYTVRQLKQTWDKLPANFSKLYNDLKRITEPSRNFQQYRESLKDENHGPAIPYLPIVLKDLTFIHLGNQTNCEDGLINFEKLRQLAREIRLTVRLTGNEYDPTMMLQSRHTFNFTESGSFFTSENRNTLSGYNTIRKGKRRQLSLNQMKKCWEEWLNILRVRTYFENLKVSCEPGTLNLMAKRVETVIYPTSHHQLTSSPNSQSSSSLMSLLPTPSNILSPSQSLHSSGKTHDSAQKTVRCDCRPGFGREMEQLPTVNGVRRIVPGCSVAKPIPQVLLPPDWSKSSEKVGHKTPLTDDNVETVRSPSSSPTIRKIPSSSSIVPNPAEIPRPPIPSGPPLDPRTLPSPPAPPQRIGQSLTASSLTIGSPATPSAPPRSIRKSVDLPRDLPPPPPPPPENSGTVIRKPSLPPLETCISCKPPQPPSYSEYLAEKETRQEKEKSATPPRSFNTTARPPPNLHRQPPPTYDSVITTAATRGIPNIPVPDLPPPLPALLPSLVNPLSHPSLPGLRPRQPGHRNSSPYAPPPMIQNHEQRATLFHQLIPHPKPPPPTPPRTVTLQEESCNRSSCDRVSSQRDSFL